MAKSKKLVAEVTLYGNGPSGCGAGFLVRLEDGRMLGTGDPVAGRSFTEAVWQAFRAAREAGVVEGLVRVFNPHGRHCDLPADRTPPYFGDLKWSDTATVYTLDVSELTK